MNEWMNEWKTTMMMIMGIDGLFQIFCIIIVLYIYLSVFFFIGYHQNRIIPQSTSTTTDLYHLGFLCVCVCVCAYVWYQIIINKNTIINVTNEKKWKKNGNWINWLLLPFFFWLGLYSLVIIIIISSSR